MNTTNNLLVEIESLRKKMIKIAANKGYTDMESIEISQELDRLLNLYESRKIKKESD